MIGIDANCGSSISQNGYIQYTSLSFYPNDGGFIHKHSDRQPNNEEPKLIHFYTILQQDHG